jgi:hypothetical protein
VHELLRALQHRNLRPSVQGDPDPLAETNWSKENILPPLVSEGRKHDCVDVHWGAEELRQLNTMSWDAK